MLLYYLHKEAAKGNAMRAKSLGFFIIPALLSLGCQPQAETQPQTQEASLDCPEIGGLDQILGAGSPEIVVIGEYHGMTAPPAFVSALTCQSLKAGLSTSLALELTDDDGRFVDYMASDGGGAAKEKLFEHSMWTTGFTDGRSSEAMLEMIDLARDRLSQGLDLQVFPFASGDYDYESFKTRNESAAGWEKTLASGVLEASAGRDKTIVLVGNIHARRGRVKWGELDYELMAEHLPKDKSLTFNVITTRGTSWNCSGQPHKCEERYSGGPITPDHAFAQDGFKIIMSEDISEEDRKMLKFDNEDYDGVIFAGQAKASPPANADNRLPMKSE